MSTERFEPYAYALLRIVAGAMFMMHGVQKILHWPGPARELTTQLWIGGVIELVAGALIVLGLFARPAALLASGTMAVAYIQFHWKLELAGNAWLPAVNRGELAALYCFVFLVIALRGAGAWSLDRARGR